MLEETRPVGSLSTNVNLATLLEQSFLNEGHVSESELSPLTSLSPSPNTSPAYPPTATDDVDILHLTAVLDSHLPSGTDAEEVEGESSKPSPSQRDLLTRRQKKAACSRAKYRMKRREERSTARVSNPLREHKPRPKTHHKYVHNLQPIKVKLQAEAFPASSTGYVGVGDGGGRRVFTLEELVGEGSRFKFRLFQWDGRTPTPIVDLKGRIIGVLVGRPDDPSWEEVHAAAARLIDESRPLCTFCKEDKSHRRGKFPALACGISHGGGQRQLKALSQDPANELVFQGLFQSPSFGCMAAYTSDAFANWAPKLHKYYDEHLGALLNRDLSLTLNFQDSVWACTTVNFGPRTASFKHMDSSNLSFGWCGITALGDFDPKVGGHIVLWECGLVIEFPPGSTILIPSACVSHSNVAIRPNEKCFSFTQYTAGGIFRWVDHGFMKEEEYWASLTPEQVEEETARGKEHLNKGLSFFSTLDELVDA